MNNKIIWEKWVDPYLPENVEASWPDYIEDFENAESEKNTGTVILKFV